MTNQLAFALRQRVTHVTLHHGIDAMLYSSAASGLARLRSLLFIVYLIQGDVTVWSERLIKTRRFIACYHLSFIFISPP